MQCWNKVLWLDVPGHITILNLQSLQILAYHCYDTLKNADWLDVLSHMTISNQSECIISVYHSYTMLKFVYDIGSSFQWQT